MSNIDQRTSTQQLQAILEKHTPTELPLVNQEADAPFTTLRDERTRREFFEDMWRKRVTVYVEIDGEVLSNAGVTRTFALSRMLGFPLRVPFSVSFAPDTDERRKQFTAILQGILATVERHGGRLECVDGDDDDAGFELDVYVTYAFPNDKTADNAASEIMEAWEIYGVIDLK